jgi:ABC-2 type transport system ATP-binding protein
MVETAPLIRVSNLGKTYGKKLTSKGFRALDGVSLEVGRGSVFGLLGPNGAGKTTLIKVLLGLARKSDGEAELFGAPAGSTAVRARVGYLPEAHRLPGYMTGRQVLEMFGMMCGRERQWLRARIPAMLELVGMREAADRKVREYSKGMQQRIGLAAAMIHEPELIFLDEPTDGVDPIGRAAIRAVVLTLKDRGVSVFINSHLLMEVELICDRVVIMNKGKILREGTIAELTPRTGRVRFELDAVPPHIAKVLEGVGSNYEAQPQGFELQVTDAELDQCVDRLRAAGVSIRGLAARRVNLEQAFIQLMQEQKR